MAAVDSKLALLKSVSLFSSMSKKDLQAVERLADQVDIPAGRVIMRQGDHGNEMYVISSGSVRVERNGKEVATLPACHGYDPRADDDVRPWPPGVPHAARRLRRAPEVHLRRRGQGGPEPRPERHPLIPARRG
jgi:hypothetical protein